MPIKDSSDELNPPVVSTGGIIAKRSKQRTASDYVALAIATCGVGYMPIAPGTWGSAVGVGIYLLLHQAFAGLSGTLTRSSAGLSGRNIELAFTAALLVVIVVVSLVGIWAATRTERILGRKDPGHVVIDEVAGQLITFLFIPFASPLWVLIAGFFIFRGFDIVKPYPVRRLESLESGLGIMADDVLAGLYAATTLSLIVLVEVFI